MSCYWRQRNLLFRNLNWMMARRSTYTGTRFNCHSEIGMNRPKRNLHLIGLRFEINFGSYWGTWKTFVLVSRLNYGKNLQQTCLMAQIIWLCSDIWHFCKTAQISVRLSDIFMKNLGFLFISDFYLLLTALSLFL